MNTPNAPGPTPTNTATTTEDGLLLSGLDGTDPLGFLAALGVLRALTLAENTKAVAMLWNRVGGTWSPSIVGLGNDLERLLTQLHAGLSVSDPVPWALDNRMPFSAATLRDADLAALAAASVRNRDRVDTLASFGVESLSDEKGAFSDTSLRMVRSGDSAGNGLTAYGRRIIEETTPDDLRNTLMETWHHEDEGCALRWSPAENNAYALQWNNPSGEKTVSVRGGNRLALAAMPLLPVVPVNGRAVTTAFSRPDGRTESLTWPLWEYPASLPLVQSLLSLSELQQERPSTEEIMSRGIAAVYRCDRVMTSTYYRNFTPGRRIA